MIAIGCCVANQAKYEALLRSVQDHCSDSVRLLRTSTTTSIAEAYNGLLREARAMEGLAALVLVHEDVEILDHRFEEKITAALHARPNTGVLGAIGGRGITSMRWWRAKEIVGRVFETRGVMEGTSRSGDVDAVDGLLLILSPRAFRELEFDEGIRGFHGYDVDICTQARRSGLAVSVIDVAVAHHSKGGYGDLRAYRATSRYWADKWGYPRPRFALLDSWLSSLANRVWIMLSSPRKRS